MPWRPALILFLVTTGYLGTCEASSCPCVVEGGKLNCIEENTIFNFPEDLTSLGCDEELEYSQLWGIWIQNQPIKTLNIDAFKKFPLLEDILMPFNSVEIVHRHAFRGLKNVKSLSLSYNNLHTIEEGALDDLVNLQQLDLPGNPKVESYTTNAWHFCNNAEEYNLGQNSLIFYKNFEKSLNTEDYCSTKNDITQDECVRTDSGTIDCTSLQDFKASPCNIRTENFTNIIFNFPKDKMVTKIEDYHEGESNAFFQEFNSQQGSMDYTKYMQEITIYGTKYDLNRIKEMTSEITQLVTIKADTVWMSAPITIGHHLNIQARVVVLDYAISMNMTKQQFTGNPSVEAWSVKEENYYVGNLMMKKKSYGLVSILQNVPSVPIDPIDSYVEDDVVCLPKLVSVEESDMDVSHWFDQTTINLHHVCVMTIMKSKNNPKLVEDLSTFMLNFVYNTTSVRDQSTFIAAQKFSRILELNKQSTVHNVPAYSIATVGSLASLMAESMAKYRVNELQQETNLTLATGRATDMQIHFETIKMQQQQYFETEMIQLDSLWESTDNQWDFDTSHRNAIEGQISTSMDAIQNQTFAIQEQELKRALDNAIMSQEHIQDNIEAFELQVEQRKMMVDSSIEVQNEFMEKLKTDSANMEVEFKNFETAVAIYQAEQIAKAVWSIFKAVVSFGIGLVTGDLESLDLGDIFDSLIEIRELIVDLVLVIASVIQLQLEINNMDLGNLADININLSTNFKDSLQTMVKLKLKGSDFNELDIKATTEFDALNRETNGEIHGMTDVMMAMQRVSYDGKQMIGEASNFAELLLNLSEATEKLSVAKNDYDRTTQQIEEITTQIEEFKAMKDKFFEDREKSRDEYEQNLKDMEAQYHNISDELRAEFKEKILLSFNNFQKSFDSLSVSYDKQMFLVLSSIHRKIYGLKEHSMTQRSMIMSLFYDFCDANYYNSFRTCEEQNLPYMSDDFDTLIDKLINLQWDTVISNEDIPGIPISFNDEHLDIDSALNNTYGGNKNLLVETLKNTGQFGINLRDLDKENDNYFDGFWRVRIEAMKIVLLDVNDNTIQSSGTTMGKQIQIRIDFPTIFNDTDNHKNSISFLAQTFSCEADYTADQQGDIDWISECKVAQAFSQYNYKSAPDGDFTFKILNPETIDIESLSKIRIYFSGTRISFDKDQEDEEPKFIKLL